MPPTADDDSEDSRPHITVGNVDNMQLLRAIGNMRMDVRQHYRALTAIYWELRNLTQPAPAMLPHRLIEAEEAHHERHARGLAVLQTIAAR